MNKDFIELFDAVCSELFDDVTFENARKEEIRNNGGTEARAAGTNGEGQDSAT